MKEYGHFLNKTYVITDRDTPRHWYNYLYNDEYVTFTSQVGFGQGFAQDSMGRRINTVTDRAVYLADEETFWLANGLPVEDNVDFYACTHGIGYTDIELERNGIRSVCRLFVPNEGKREILSVTLTNKSEKPRTLRVIPYCATAIDCNYKPQGYETNRGGFDAKSNSVFGEGWSDFGDGNSRIHYAYITSSETASGFDARSNAFIGTYGTKITPKALVRNGGCTNSDCIAEKICLALQNTVVLESGETHVLYYAIGTEQSTEEIPRLCGEDVERQFAKMAQKYEAICGKVEIETPWSDLNALFNDWLKYQTNLGSRWARVRHNGFRDLTSDTECLSCIDGPLSAERFCRILGYQYSNGYAPRTFLDGSIQDKNFSDNTVWLVFAAYAITMELGDKEFLNRTARFNDGTEASVYEHIKRSLEFLWNFTGHHGLIRIWGGDWNDCMNMAGKNGKGVSIWLSIAFVRAAKMLAKMAKLLGYAEDETMFSDRASVMEQRIREFGWDGDRYIYAISDNGTPIGASENEEGSMFALPQLWSVFAELDSERSKTAMDTLERELNTDLGLLVSAPPYTKFTPHVGAISKKFPGLHENGGAYLHAAVWKLAVDSLLGRNEKIEEGLHKILPSHHEYYETCGEP
ncbi:MAG: hypothetical protein IKA76_05245, partial [Clostridia bacterium]|nr:hypothetical protein [Clostridia bacterium]